VTDVCGLTCAAGVVWLSWSLAAVVLVWCVPAVLAVVVLAGGPLGRETTGRAVPFPCA
jgi:hypothetical protein